MGPSAASSIGGGGLSGAATQPPVPGFMHAPPLAASPFPKEADVRPAPTLLAELLGTPTPLELMLSADSRTPSATPYFMDHAGLAQASLGGTGPVPPGSLPSLPGTRALAPDSVPTAASGSVPTAASGSNAALPGSMPTSFGALPTPLAPAFSPDFARLIDGPSEPLPALDSSAGLPVALSASSERALPEAPRPALSAVESTPHAGYSPELVPDLGSSPGIFDANAISRDFPILEERVQGNKRLIWLDNAATTQKPRAVIDRLTYFYEHENSSLVAC